VLQRKLLEAVITFAPSKHHKPTMERDVLRHSYTSKHSLSHFLSLLSISDIWKLALKE